MPWAILWRSENRLDGKREHYLGTPTHPCRTLLFETRREARACIQERFGFIRTRADLHVEPHGWKMPIAVRVNVLIERAAA